MNKRAKSVKSVDRIAIEGCFANADELLRGARALVERERLPRLAYHLALLALEEVGKAPVLSVKVVSAREDRELPSSIRAPSMVVNQRFVARWPLLHRVRVSGGCCD
jgi:AbiV